MRKNILWMAAVALCGCGLTLIAQDAGTAPAFKPAASLHALMHGQESHLLALKELLDNAKAKDRISNLATHAELLAELANVNIYHNEKADYRAWARDLRETSLEFAKEAKARGEKSEANMKAGFERIKTLCTACHDAYQ